MIELTVRQTMVCDLLCSGLASKEIAVELKISPRTVEVHRSRIRKKYGARNTADLVRMVLLGETSKTVSGDV
jgi:two-component system response regulator FixJ